MVPDTYESEDDRFEALEKLVYSLNRLTWRQARDAIEAHLKMCSEDGRGASAECLLKTVLYLQV